MPITYTNEIIIIKCNKCGTEICFYPHTCVSKPSCTNCDNTDSGSALRDWPKNKFGDFCLLHRGMETLSIPMPWDKE